ncbi:MAG: NAD-binding protein, partial [Amphiplicatus sp.]
HRVVGGIAELKLPSLIVIDTCTLAIEDKKRAGTLLAGVGTSFLDGAVSGNRLSVLKGRAKYFLSGERGVYEKIETALSSALGPRLVRYVGSIGDASRLKYILNLLVLIHNAAAAEAMALAERAGLSLDHVYSSVYDSFASSEVFHARARMMVDREYDQSRGGYGVARKDAGIIAAFAEAHGAPTPVFKAALEMHYRGIEQGFGDQDTASLFEAYLGIDTG